MAHVFVQPISLASLLLFFVASLFILIYVVYFSVKRTKILNLRKMPTIFIIGFPNSGRTSIMKALSMNEVGIMDRILNIGYMDLVYDGKMALKVLDHMGTFYSDGKINDGMLRDVKTIDPACIIGVIDVSWFSAPIENQIQFMMKVRDIFANKKLFLIASKVDKTSRDKLKMIEKTFGKNIYKLSLEKPRNVEKLRKDILDCFSKNRAGLHSK